MEKYLTISSITKYLKFKLDTDDNLKKVYLKGEISNFKSHSMGHLYFSLKDESSKINAIMFSLNAKKLNFTPSDGMKVLVVGRISVYEPTGNYQIYVSEMIEDGGSSVIAIEESMNDDEKVVGLSVYVEDEDKSNKLAIRNNMLIVNIIGFLALILMFL